MLRSIKAKLLLFVLCISLIPITAGSSVAYLYARRALKKETMDRMIAVAESRKAQVLEFLTAKRERTVDFSSDGFIRDKLETVVHGEIDKATGNLNSHLTLNKLPLDPSLIGTAVLDRGGNVVASTDETWIGKGLYDREIFTQSIGAASGEVFTDRLRYSPELDTDGVFVSAPLTSRESGETVGVIINVFDPAVITDTTGDMAKQVRTIDFSSDGFIRDNLEIIAHGEFFNKRKTATDLTRHLIFEKKQRERLPMEIALLDKEGKVVASTDKMWALAGKDMSDHEAFAQAFGKGRDEVVVGQPHYTPYLETNSIFFSTPVLSRRTFDTIGVLINAYDLAILNEITGNRAGMGETGEIVLGQRAGDNIVFLNTLRYAPDAAPLSLSVPVGSAEAEAMRLALEGGNGAIIALDYRNVPVVAAYQDIPSLNWGLVAKIDETEAFAPLRWLSMIALITWLASAAAATGMTFFFASSMSRPIKKLTNATERFTKGDLKTRVEVTRKDEIGDLATSFNAMAGELSSEIAAHERAEEALREEGKRLKVMSGELTATNKELEAFCYSVSHDLRAPLRGIDGFSKALVEDYADKLDDTGKDYIARVRAASQRMALLIDDLLALSRITRSGIHHETVDLSKLTRGVAEELQKAEPGRNVEFVVADGLTAYGDERLLQLVLTNLLGNAWKFTGKIESPRIEFGKTEHEGKTAYFVRDNGAGFDMSYADKLFGAFQRLHTHTEFEGSGIGLATVQRIINRHGGHVWAEGELGKGATFYFTL